MNSTTAVAKSFAVASMRAVPSNDGCMTSIGPYGTGFFTATCVSLPVLISLAYGIDDKLIEKLPKGYDSLRFDVSARAEEEVKPEYEQLKPLLQDLLIHRLHLAVHHSTADVAGYALVLAGGSKRLPPATELGGTSYITKSKIRGSSISMDTFAHLITRPVGRPVVDMTGLRGNYDITLSYASNGETDSGLPSIFTAVKEQLGLELKSGKVAVDTLVVDHVDREPIDN